MSIQDFVTANPRQFPVPHRSRAKKLCFWRRRGRVSLKDLRQGSKMNRLVLTKQLLEERW